MEKFFDRMGFAGLSMLAVGVIGTRFIFVVDGGERVVLFNKFSGLKPEVYGEGMHYKTPIVEEPRHMTIRTRYRLINSQTGTKDMQQVKITLRLLFKPVEKELPRILNEYGVDYDEKILPSIGNEELKQVVAQFTAEELIIQRQDVSLKIRERLHKRSAEFGLILDDVSITDLVFDPAYQRSIEQKQVAQQQAEQAKYVVLRREQEKKATIIRASADAEAATLVSEAIASNGAGLIAMRKIEAAQIMAEQLAQNPNINFVHANNTLNMLNLNKQ